MRKQLRIAHQGQLQPGTSHCHVEFAVDESSVLQEGVSTEEVELPWLLYGEAVYDVVSLAALKSLYRVYAYSSQ